MFTRATIRRRIAASLLAGVCLAAPALAGAADVTISVTSENPASGVFVSPCCGEVCIQIVQATPFDFLCAQGSQVTLAVPPSLGPDQVFLEWRRDGAPFATDTTAVFTADVPRTLTAVYGAPPPPAPDFTVTGATLVPASPTAGYTFRASVVVKNTGTAAGDGGQLCAVLDEAGVLPCGCPGAWAREAIGWLDPGESRPFELTGLPAGAAGTRVFRAFADAECAAAEPAETDNQLGRVYTVATRSVRTLEVATLDGRAVAIAHTPDVEGNGAGTAPFTHTFTAGASVTLLAPAVAPDGGVFQKWAELGQPVTSSRSLVLSLAASRSLMAVYVGPGEPDYAVASIVLTPPSPPPGGLFSAEVTVENRGTAAGVAGVLGIFLDSPAPAACGPPGGRERDAGALAVGESRTFTFADLPAGAAGAKVFRAAVDATCLTDEPDEADNQATAAYRVNAAPRLDAPGDQAGTEGEEIAFAVPATDDDGDPVTLEAQNLPAGATFDAAGGVFRWRPAFDQAGRHEGLRFIAADPWGAWDDASVAIEVTQPSGPVFTDDFADAVRAGDADWAVLAGAWRGGAGTYRAAAPRRFNLAAVAALDPSTLPLGAGVLRARVRLPGKAASRLGPNAYLVFAQQDDARFRWVRILRGRVQIGQTGEVGGVAPGVAAGARRRTVPGRWYRWTVEVHPDGCVAVYRGPGDSPVASHCFTQPDGTPSLVPGGVGLATSRSAATFDDVEVWEDSALAQP